MNIIPFNAKPGSPTVRMAAGLTRNEAGHQTPAPGATPSGWEAGDALRSLPRATALSVPSIHPERRPCGACGDPTDEQDIYGDPLCDECGKSCTYCADCSDEIAHEYFTGIRFAEHQHCRPKGIHRQITACVCDEPCKSPICTCEAAS